MESLSFAHNLISSAIYQCKRELNVSHDAIISSATPYQLLKIEFWI
jgi:hypothetical protein